MKAINLVFFSLTIIGLLEISSCKKEETDNDYKLCPECTNEELVGQYNGDGIYYTDDDQELTEDVDVSLNMELSTATIFDTKISVPDKFTETYFIGKEEGGAGFTMSGSNSSLTMTVYKKESGYKLTGTAKVYHSSGDSTYMDHSVSFTVYK